MNLLVAYVVIGLVWAVLPYGVGRWGEKVALRRRLIAVAVWPWLVCRRGWRDFKATDAPGRVVEVLFWGASVALALGWRAMGEGTVGYLVGFVTLLAFYGGCQYLAERWRRRAGKRRAP